MFVSCLSFLNEFCKFSILLWCLGIRPVTLPSVTYTLVSWVRVRIPNPNPNRLQVSGGGGVSVRGVSDLEPVFVCILLSKLLHWEYGWVEIHICVHFYNFNYFVVTARPILVDLLELYYRLLWLLLRGANCKVRRKVTFCRGWDISYCNESIFLFQRLILLHPKPFPFQRQITLQRKQFSFSRQIMFQKNQFSFSLTDHTATKTVSFFEDKSYFNENTFHF